MNATLNLVESFVHTKVYIRDKLFVKPREIKIIFNVKPKYTPKPSFHPSNFTHQYKSFLPKYIQRILFCGRNMAQPTASKVKMHLQASLNAGNFFQYKIFLIGGKMILDTDHQCSAALQSHSLNLFRCETRDSIGLFARNLGALIL